MLYGCVPQSLTLIEYYRFMANHSILGYGTVPFSRYVPKFRNNILLPSSWFIAFVRRKVYTYLDLPTADMTWGWRTLPFAAPYFALLLPNNIRQLRAEHHGWERIKTRKNVWTENLKGRDPFDDLPRCRGKDDIKIDLNEIGRRDLDQWRALASIVTNLLHYYLPEKFSTSRSWLVT